VPGTVLVCAQGWLQDPSGYARWANPTCSARLFDVRCKTYRQRLFDGRGAAYPMA